MLKKEGGGGMGGLPSLSLFVPLFRISSTFLTDSRGNACYAGTLVP